MLNQNYMDVDKFGNLQFCPSNSVIFTEFPVLFL